MRQNRTCPKCESLDIVEIPGGMVGKNWLPTGLSTVPIDRWVCCTCGYTEEYVAQDKLDKVREYWQ